LWILSCWRFEKKIILWCTNLLMIKAVKFWCEGSFQVLIEENDATWSRRVKSLSLGRLTSPAYFKKTQASKLGDAQGIPSASTNHQVLSNDAIFLLLHTSIFFLGASVCLFSFVCCYTCWILAFLCGRETRSTCFILNTLVLHLYLLSIPV
jgi:hypothetical protein